MVILQIFMKIKAWSDLTHLNSQVIEILIGKRAKFSHDHVVNV